MGCQGSKSTATGTTNGQKEEHKPNDKKHVSIGFVMSAAQIEALKQAFREVDINNDNALSVDELRHVFHKQGKFSEKDIQQFIIEADQNGNRRVEFDEFVALITAKIETTIKGLREVFDSFDADKSGSLTKKELQQLLQILEVDSSSSHAEKIFKKIDENHDGKISFDEFVAMAMEIWSNWIDIFLYRSQWTT